MGVAICVSAVLCTRPGIYGWLTSIMLWTERKSAFLKPVNLADIFGLLCLMQTFTHDFTKRLINDACCFLSFCLSNRNCGLMGLWINVHICNKMTFLDVKDVFALGLKIQDCTEDLCLWKIILIVPFSSPKYVRNEWCRTACSWSF